MQKLIAEIVMFFGRIRPAEMENLLVEDLRDGVLELTEEKRNDGFIVKLKSGWTFSLDWDKKETDTPFYHLHIPANPTARECGQTYSGQVYFSHGKEAVALFDKVIDALLAA